MATATDDNAAYEKSDKSIWWLLNIRCTRRSPGQLQTKTSAMYSHTLWRFLLILLYLI